MPKVREEGRLSAYRGDKFNPHVVHTLFPGAEFRSQDDRYVEPLFYPSSELTKLICVLQATSQYMTLQLI